MKETYLIETHYRENLNIRFNNLEELKIATPKIFEILNNLFNENEKELMNFINDLALLFNRDINIKHAYSFSNEKLTLLLMIEILSKLFSNRIIIQEKSYEKISFNSTVEDKKILFFKKVVNKEDLINFIVNDIAVIKKMNKKEYIASNRNLIILNEKVDDKHVKNITSKDFDFKNKTFFETIKKVRVEVYTFINYIELFDYKIGE